jgi:hypothetical protein
MEEFGALTRPKPSQGTIFAPLREVHSTGLFKKDLFPSGLKTYAHGTGTRWHGIAASRCLIAYHAAISFTDR